MTDRAKARFGARVVCYTLLHWVLFAGMFRVLRDFGVFASTWSPVGVALSLLGLPFVTPIELTEGIVPEGVSRLFWKTLPVLSWVNSVVWGIAVGALMNRVERKWAANTASHGTLASSRP